MEKEQIIKALECCIEDECENCPYDEQTACREYFLHGALALIKQQDEQIFQLENRLKECENGYAGTLHLERNKLYDAEEKVKELTEDNERLEAEIQLRNMLISDASNRIEEIRADTVREFAERLKKSLNDLSRWSTHGEDGEYFIIGKAFIDRIAKEILNKTEDEEK